MTKDSLLLMLEVLSSIRFGPVTHPEFERSLEGARRLFELRKDIELELQSLISQNVPVNVRD